MILRRRERNATPDQGFRWIFVFSKLELGISVLYDAEKKDDETLNYAMEINLGNL